MFYTRYIYFITQNCISCVYSKHDDHEEDDDDIGGAGGPRIKYILNSISIPNLALLFPYIKHLMSCDIET
jgi:hypothetical protein